MARRVRRNPIFSRSGIDSDAAHDLFERERARFARRFPWISTVNFQLIDSRCPRLPSCDLRDLAYADLDDGMVVMVRRALQLPKNNFVGLIRHELGHLSDVHVDQPGAEQRADDIAEAVTGKPIRYDANDIQTVGPGKYPRPLYLHR